MLFATEKSIQGEVAMFAKYFPRIMLLMYVVACGDLNTDVQEFGNWQLDGQGLD